MDREELKYRWLHALVHKPYFYIPPRKKKYYILKPLILTETTTYTSQEENLKDCIIVDVSDLNEYLIDTEKETQEDEEDNGYAKPLENKDILLDKGTYKRATYKIDGFYPVIVDYDYSEDTDIYIYFWDKINHCYVDVTFKVVSTNKKNIDYIGFSQYQYTGGFQRYEQHKQSSGTIEYENCIQNKSSSTHMFAVNNVPNDTYTITLYNDDGKKSLSGNNDYLSYKDPIEIEYNGEFIQKRIELLPKPEIRRFATNILKDDNDKVLSCDYYIYEQDSTDYSWKFVAHLYLQGDTQVTSQSLVADKSDWDFSTYNPWKMSADFKVNIYYTHRYTDYEEKPI